VPLPVGWHLAVRVFPGKSLETLWPKFHREGGALDPSPMEWHLPWLSLISEW
jgi:hypothetical protein